MFEIRISSIPAFNLLLTRACMGGSPQMDKTKVLIVEDNEEMLEILTLSLEAEGFTITTAQSGIEAIKKARANHPDVILLDLMLPEMDGFGVCETLRRHEATADLPILVVSGVTGEFTRLASLESGGTEFISKPAKPSDLAARIRAAVAVQAVAK